MQRALSAAPRLPWVTTAVAVAALLVHWIPGCSGALQLSWPQVADGEVWRLATGQLTHWSGSHLWWDLTTFALVGSLCELANRRRFLICLLLCFTVLPLLIYSLVEGIALFRGLSGVDCGLFALAAGGFAGDSGRRTRLVGGSALILLVGKVWFEVVTGQTLFVDGGGVAAVPTAHAIGATLGVFAAVLPGRSAMPWLRSICARETEVSMSVREYKRAVWR